MKNEYGEVRNRPALMRGALMKRQVFPTSFDHEGRI